MSIFLLTLIAAVVSQILSAIWYMSLFGKKWGMAIGHPMPTTEDKKMGIKQMAWPLVIGFVGHLLAAFVTFLILAGFGANTIGQALITVAVLFVGFSIPQVAGAVMWKGFTTKQQWMQFGITIGFQAINFVVWALIFVWLV
ncbi:MAG: hypothetical protein JWM20_124 [Patescibacteria group bacterium]|nr:hypothetical protein [Patescibacteria group bacterium]